MRLLLLSLLVVVAAEARRPLAFGVEDVDFRVGCTAGVESASWRRNASCRLTHSNAQFLVLRVTQLRLPPAAVLTIRDGSNSSEEIRFVGGQDDEQGRVALSPPLYTRPLYTHHVMVEYIVPPTIGSIARNCYGFHIDQYRFAAQSASRTKRRPAQHLRYKDYDTSSSGPDVLSSATTSSTSSPLAYDECTTPADDSTRVACVRFDAAAFAKTNSVARLLVHKAEGSVFCTGWLLGCDGHVMTNHHCVGGADEAAATTIEFRAQGASCDQDCDAPFACPGVVEATQSDLVAYSPLGALDFSLLQPRLPIAQRRGLAAKYGFLSLRPQGPTLSERIFIPQHPAGFGKRVAMKHGAAHGSVATLADTGCNELPDKLGYLLATKGGSSGAPVIGYQDMAVVGLHYCGGCLNSAIPSHRIVAALQDAGQLPGCALAR